MTPQQITARLDELAGRPCDDDTVTALARIPAGAVRVLNHATFDGTAPAAPATLCAVTGHLAALAARLPQLCDQLADRLDRQQHAGHLADDTGRAADDRVRRARHYLHDAARLASELERIFAATQIATSHLSSTGEGEDQ